MKKTKTRKFTVIPNADLALAARGFVPVFGNEEDRLIVNRLKTVHAELEKFDNKVLRAGKKLTKTMKDVLFMENRLIHSITKRNLDF